MHCDMHTHGHHMTVTETSQIFCCNTFLYWLANRYNFLLAGIFERNQQNNQS